MTVTQDRDHEGVATFDPLNSQQARLAKRYAGISARKTATPV
jgi:hypothetical protein